MKKFIYAVVLMLCCGTLINPSVLASTSTSTVTSSSQSDDVEVWSGNASAPDGQSHIYIRVYSSPNSCYSYYAVYKDRTLAVKTSDGGHHYDHLYKWTHMVELDGKKYYFKMN